MPTLAAASEWMVRHARLVIPGQSMLDVACGYGRHAKFFAQRGVQVTAVDRDVAAITSLQDQENIVAECRDIEGQFNSADAWPYAANAFDSIIVCNYLWRPTLAPLLASIKPRGVLLYETFMVGNERYGKPSRAEFLLRSGELSEIVAPQFDVHAQFEGPIADSSGEVVAIKSMIAAIKR